MDRAMDLNDVRTFAAVASVGSFTGAARALTMPKSTVSRRVADLEENLGVRLLTRTTRKMSLTDAGRALLERLSGPLDEVEAALRAVVDPEGPVTGTVRVTSPPDLGAQLLGATLPDFLKRYPGVSVEVDPSSRMVDLVGEGYDVALRAQRGQLTDSTLVARKLGGACSTVMASPEFIERHVAEHGPLLHPSDLEGLPALMHHAFSVGSDGFELTHAATGTQRLVHVRPVVTSTSFGLLMEAAVRGAGISLMPRQRLALHGIEGDLVEVLPEWEGPSSSFYAVFPTSRLMAPAVRAFVDFLPAAIGELSFGPFNPPVPSSSS